MPEEIYFSTYKDKRRGCYRGYAKAPGKKPIYVSGRTEQECKIKLVPIIEQLKRGDYTSPSSITLEHYIGEWIESRAYDLSQTTWEDYKSKIKNHIIPALGKMKLQQIQPAHIRNMYTETLKDHSVSLTRHLHAIMRKMLTTAQEDKIISSNPALLVPRPSSTLKPKKEVEIYTDTEYKKLLKISRGTIHEIPIMLAGTLGMRRGEIMGLRWSDIDLEKGSLTINRTRVMAGREEVIKTPKSSKSSRKISLPDHIRLRLKEIKGKAILTTHGYCVIKPDGSPANLNRYSNDFRDFVKSHGINYKKFHSLRHYNATLMLRCGVDLKTASGRLGHSTTHITADLYQHVLDDMDIAAAAKINEFFTEKKKKKSASR